jgi:hypothetical protein
MVRAGASDDEIGAALRDRPKYTKEAARGLGDRYIARTVAWARDFHDRDLVRVRVMSAHVEHFDADDERPPLAGIALRLRMLDRRTWLYTDIVVPDEHRPQARPTWDAVVPDVLARRVLALPRGSAVRDLVGRGLDVALRGSSVVWLREAPTNALKIQRRAGHSDGNTTQIYIREAESLRAGFGDPFPVLPASLGGASDPSTPC